MPRATLFSQTPDRRRVFEFPLADDLTFTYRDSLPGSISFSLPNRALPNGDPLRTVLDPEVHEVGIQYGREIIWCGPLLTAREEPTELPGRVQFGGEGLMAYLRKWHVTGFLEGATTVPTDPDLGTLYVEAEDGSFVPETFYSPIPPPETPRYVRWEDSFILLSEAKDREEKVPPGQLWQVDQHQIIKRLIDFHQGKPGGDVGIITSTLGTSGVPRDRNYDPATRKNIFLAVDQLCKVINGPSFGIRPGTREAVARTGGGTYRRDLVFDRSTVANLTHEIDGTLQASRILGVGAGEGEQMLTVDKQSNAAVARYGLTERVYTNKDVSRHSTMSQHVDRELDLYGEAPEVVGLVLNLNKVGPRPVDVGDYIKVEFTTGYTKLSGWYQVGGWDVTPADNTVTLYIGDAGDA